jgi:serine/threonine-protein kinase
VVHRDIRVPNVLINEDEVYLVDFGLARLIDQDRYRPELDFVFFGDFIIHLLYSNYARTMKLRKQPWHKELALTDLQCLFLKRLLGLDDKYGNIDEIEEDFKVFFDPLVCL